MPELLPGTKKVLCKYDTLVVLKYIHKFFDVLPFKTWNLSPLALQLWAGIMTHFS